MDREKMEDLKNTEIDQGQNRKARLATKEIKYGYDDMSGAKEDVVKKPIHDGENYQEQSPQTGGYRKGRPRINKKIYNELGTPKKVDSSGFMGNRKYHKTRRDIRNKGQWTRKKTAKFDRRQPETPDMDMALQSLHKK